MIKIENGKRRYFDRNGKEIVEGCKIKFLYDKTMKQIETVYLTEYGELGTDATNKRWIASGRAFPCEYGIYPLENNMTNNVEVIEN